MREKRAKNVSTITCGFGFHCPVAILPQPVSLYLDLLCKFPSTIQLQVTVLGLLTDLSRPSHPRFLRSGQDVFNLSTLIIAHRLHPAPAT